MLLDNRARVDQEVVSFSAPGQLFRDFRVDQGTKLKPRLKGPSRDRKRYNRNCQCAKIWGQCRWTVEDVAPRAGCGAEH